MLVALRTNIEHKLFFLSLLSIYASLKNVDMKNLVLFSFLCFFVLDIHSQPFGILIDSRDGQEYKTVKLKDGKVWMAQNLNFDIGEECWESSGYKEYGRLYTWESAQRACPPCWHLPSDQEWWEMSKHYGMAFNRDEGQQKNISNGAGKSAYKSLIKDGGDSGFSALLGGYRSTNGSFDYLGFDGSYWSSTARSSSSAWYYYFLRFTKDLRRSSYDRDWALSCRCVQD